MSLRCLAWSAAPLVLLACVEPQLGEAPFYCNNGVPECPEGYVCEKPAGKPGGLGVCIKPGTTPPPTTDGRIARTEGSVIDTGLPPQPDSKRPADRSVLSDQPLAKWDRGPDTKAPPDKGPPPPDGIPAHLGCQSNTECSTSNPCCCPVPLVPQIWACLPICFNPFCF